MANRVVYHNPTTMGYGVDKVPTSPFSALSGKCLPDYEGDVFWIIGKKQEKLSPVFIRVLFVVEKRFDNMHHKLKYKYMGRSGLIINPLIPIDDLELYESLRLRTGSFAFGLTEISGALLRDLQAVIISAGYHLPM